MDPRQLALNQFNRQPEVQFVRGKIQEAYRLEQLDLAVELEIVLGQMQDAALAPFASTGANRNNP